MKMKRFAQSLVAACALAAAAPLGAEVFTSTYSTTQCQDYNLITEMLIGPGVARHPNGAKIPQTSNVQIGVFSNLVAQALPSFTNGVILSTGKIDDGPSLVNTSAGHAWPDEALPGFGRDADLDRHFGESLSDPAGLLLYVQPRNKTLNIPFVMASEEFYNELVGTPAVDLPTQETYEQYSDKFAFFLKEVADASDADAFDADGNVIDDGSPMTVNIARLPDGGDVEIASVNQHTNTAFFISNVVADADGALVFPAQDIPLPMEFNGAIVGPVAVAEGLDTNKIYKLKIVIGDGYDNTVNSAVFLRDRGITSGADLKMAVEGPAHLAGTRTATFTDTVSNVGPATADGVKVTHFLPVGADPDSVVVESCDAGAVDPSSWGVVGGTNYFVWTVGDGFAPGSNAVLRIRCLLPEGEGVYTNAATVATSTGDYDESNNAAACTTVVGALPPLRIAAVATNKVYGAEMACDDLQFVLSVEGTGEALAATGIDVAFTNALGEAAQPTNAAAVVGAYGIVLSNVRGIDLSVYGGVTYVPGVLTVEPAPLTVRAKDAAKTYGEALTPTAYEVEGLLNGDAVTSVGLASDGSPEEAPCGEYPIAVGDVRGTGLENYLISPERGTLTVAKRALEITARNMGKRYGEALDFVGDEFLLTRGTLVGEDAVEMVALASDGAPAAAPCRAGGYPITPSDAQGAGLENYEIAYVDGTLDVEKAALTITAGDAAKTYGEEKALTAYTVDGLLNGDAVTAVALASDGAAAAAPWRAAGYPITASAAQGAGLANYEIAYEDGLLTVAKRALTVKANDAAKTYGEAVAFAGTEFTLAAGALAAGDTLDAVTLASDGAAATAPWRAAGYPIAASGAQGTGLENYEITYADGLLTVAKRALTVKANDAAKTYGEAVAFTGTEFTLASGALAAGDSIEAVALASDGAAAAAPYREGGYPIAASGARGAGLENYEIAYEEGLLTVAKRALTVTARNMRKTYGEALDFVGDEFLLTRGTLAAGDRLDAVTLASEGAPATAPYRAGGYPITPSDAQGAGLANYAIAYEDGTLEIAKRALTIKANDAAKTYGDAVAFTGTEFTLVSGALAAGDTLESVALASDGAAATAAWRAAGYPITASAAQGTGLANYEIAYEDGLLTVAKRALTVKANDAAKTYGEAVAFAGTEFTLAAGTLAAGDTLEAVALASDGAAATAPWRAAGYPITASAARGAGLANYEIAYEDGLLTVAKRALTVKANDAAKTYGEAVTFTGTEFTLAAGTLAAGDSIEAVALASAGAAATAPWRADGYPIAASGARGAGLENYEIAYADGLLTVAKRALTVTARNMRKRYGEALDFVGDEFLLTHGTLAAGDRLDAVTLASEGAPATAPYRAGGYPITPSAAQGAGLENYAIAYEDGTLEIAKRALLITAHDAVKAYGEALTFEGTEFTVSGELQNGERVETVTLTSEKAAAADTEVGEYAAAIAPGFEVTGLDAGNYDIAFSNGTLTVTQAVLTVAVNDAKWRVGKARPSYSFADFSAQLRGGDTVADVTGGAGLATDVVYTNAVWGAAEPTEADEGVYAAEIWIDLASLDGARAANYAVTVEPGDLTVAAAEAELRTSVTAKLNWNTGLLDLTLTIRNEGDGEVDPDYDYWVELKGGPAASGETASVARTFYLDAPTGTMPGGFDYVDLTARVKAALRGVGNGDEVFDPGEAVTVTGVRVYHWKRWSPDRFLDADAFFVAGRLFCPADTDRNFSVSEAEKAAAAALLGTSSADYLEVSRLALLAFYRWDAATGTWK